MTSPTESPGAPAPRLRRSTFGAAIGILISVGLLFLAVRSVDIGAAWEHARSARALPLILTVAIATLAFPIRVVRWRALLHTSDGIPLPAGPAWHAVAMGFMANNIFPFRAGELLRAYAIGKLAPVPFPGALSSIAVERVLDGLTLLGLLALGLFASGIAADTTIGSLSVTSLVSRVGVLSVLALGGALAVVLFPRHAENLLRRLVPFPTLAERLAGLVHGVAAGFAALGSPRRLAAAILWSGVLWGVNASSFYVGFQAFDIPVSFAGALVLQGVLAFGIAVPSSPGYVGLFEGAVILALALYAVPADLAFAYAATYHVLTFLPITLLGLWSVTRTSIGLGDLRRSAA